MNNDERVDLINRVCEWVFDNTESWEFRNTGINLAYLVWAIAADTSWVGPDDEVSDDQQELIRIIKENPNGLWDELVKQRLVADPDAMLIEIHVRGGVAYPPEHVPGGIRVEIIDHDNEGR